MYVILYYFYLSSDWGYLKICIFSPGVPDGQSDYVDDKNEPQGKCNKKLKYDPVHSLK